MPKKAVRKIPAQPAPLRRTERPRRAARDAAPSAVKGGADYQVQLATPERRIAFTPGRDFAWLSRKWGYRLRNRLRWKDTPGARDDYAKEAVEDLGRAGLAQKELEDIARSSLIEVGMPWRSESHAWEARTFPWEYVLTAATRHLGRPVKLNVVRRLERSGSELSPDHPSLKTEPRVLFVESAPGPLREYYDFEAEADMVRAALAPARFELLRDPSLARLEATVHDFGPDLVHLSGFDTRQAARILLALGEELLPERRPDGGPSEAGARAQRAAATTPQNSAESPKRTRREGTHRDGYVLAEGRGAIAVGGETLGRVLNSAKRPLRFVGCNLYDSALRIAPMAVAFGAGGSLGFRDFEHDALMEMFFSRFYRAWRRGPGGTLAGFSSAWQAVRDQTDRDQPHDVRGTTIALWTSESCLPHEKLARRHCEDLAAADRKPMAAPAGADDFAKVDVVPCEKLNYSLLHNNGSPFDRFFIHKFPTGRMTDVSVLVELAVGTQTFVHRRTLEIVDSPCDLTNSIHFPLAWSLARELHEEVRTTIFVEVVWAGKVLQRKTYPVTLLPVSEWHDTPEDDPWLPTFVLPRDPAVLKVAKAAERYLSVLDDSPAAGFDGYQSYEAADQGAATHRRVRALWYALIQDLAIEYSDPPPVYNIESQRLRTPSEVLNGGRGTCIDLALLFASCLEYAGLYPVLFLLDDHAFPGYWVSEADHDDFERIQGESGSGPRRQAGGERESDERQRGQQYAWSLGRGNLAEVLELVRERKVIPLETVDLAWRDSLETAQEEGAEHFEGPEKHKKFLAMLDVAIARKHGVTPLPFPEGSILAAAE